MRLLAFLLVAAVACKSSDKTEDHASPPAPAPAKPAEPPPPPPATGPTAGFDRSCTAATDCVVVKPATCDPCGCPTDAIASKAMAAFDAAQNKLECPPPDLKVKCAACAPRVAACQSGVCVANAK